MESIEAALVDLPRIRDPRGNLSFIQNYSQVPFEIARAYWIYDVPGGECRHGHAFYSQTELIVALSGSFDVVVDDGRTAPRTIHLSRSYKGLLVPPLTWRSLDNFSTNSVAMVLSSGLYTPDDYIRDYDQFKTLVSDAAL